MADSAPPAAPPARATVLELRVHGVNNTTPAALLDLPTDGIQLAAGDTLGSFWEPTADALAAATPDKRGHVPDGVAREAYSWGGMVRTTPNFGAPGVAGTVAAVLARLYYALVLPYSLGNAAQWTRSLAAPAPGVAADRRSRVTAALARLFGLLLTLLFTTTVVTVAMDIGAAQCGADPSLCGPIEALLAPLAGWRPGQRLALFALAPVGVVLVLWIVSTVSQLRYDVLPGMEGNVATPASGTPPDTTITGPAQAVLSVPGFWSNRVTRYLSRTHLAGAFALTTAFAGMQASLGWRTGCRGLLPDIDCVVRGSGDVWFWVFAAFAAVGWIGVIASAWLACTLPTMRILSEEEVKTATANRVSGSLLGCTVGVFALAVVLLALGPAVEVPAERLYGSGLLPLVLVTIAAAITLSGLFWRPRQGAAATAWNGAGPAVFMAIALSAATAASAIVVVSVGDFLNGSFGPAALIGQVGEAAPEVGRVTIAWSDEIDGTTGSVRIGTALVATGGISISRAYVALGTAVLVCLAVALLIVVVFALLPRSVQSRAEAWRQAPTAFPQPEGGEVPPVSAESIQVPEGGVLPPSPASLYRRIDVKRRSAARLHVVEPAAAVLAVAFGSGLLLGILWTLWAFAAGLPLWGESALSWLVIGVLNVAMSTLAWLGVVVVAVLATGATAGGTRPLGIVWDIACYLPRTGHPFGPPCYAERAVPEIAGRLNRWLRADDSHRAILAAHSMGAVLAVSALGLLASSTATNGRLPRIALLTFGVQLRPFFGRMLPELLGPEVLGTHSSVRPSPTGDPWSADLARESARQAGPLDPSPRAAPPAPPPVLAPPVGRVAGTLVPRTAAGPVPVRWVSLWRLTDYLGYPAFSTAPRGIGWENHVDRYASELDKSGYMVEVGTHGEYYRVAEYAETVAQLRDLLDSDGSAPRRTS